jgi:hypothetical protein
MNLEGWRSSGCSWMLHTFAKRPLYARDWRAACHGTIRADRSCWNWSKILSGAPPSLKRQNGARTMRAAPDREWRSPRPATNLRSQHDRQFGSKVASMEHRGVSYAIRIGISPGQWCVAIYPEGDGIPKERLVYGTREEAEATAHSMINALLKKAIRPENASDA